MQKTSPRSLEKTQEVRSHLLSDNNIRESVSLRAYELYKRRGAGHGMDLEDWAQAESEVLSPLMEQTLKLSRETSQEMAGSATSAKRPSRKAKWAEGFSKSGGQ